MNFILVFFCAFFQIMNRWTNVWKVCAKYTKNTWNAETQTHQPLHTTSANCLTFWIRYVCEQTLSNAKFVFRLTFYRFISFVFVVVVALTVSRFIMFGVSKVDKYIRTVQQGMDQRENLRVVATGGRYNRRTICIDGSLNHFNTLFFGCSSSFRNRNKKLRKSFTHHFDQIFVLQLMPTRIKNTFFLLTQLCQYTIFLLSFFSSFKFTNTHNRNWKRKWLTKYHQKKNNINSGAMFSITLTTTKHYYL